MSNKVINKKIVLFLDGTWDNAILTGERSTTTHVWRLSRAIVNDQGPTSVFYQPGVGSETTEKAANIIAGATGLGLSNKVIDAYEFVATNWVQGDKIYIFGFSRGAYTARVVCDLICKLGILNRTDIEQLPVIFDAYLRRDYDPKAEALVKVWQEKASAIKYPVGVEFIGVFETVGALGLPGGLFRTKEERRYLGFDDLVLDPRVKHGRHAMALNENRQDFNVTKWQRSRHAPEAQTVKQCWFTGSHSDVGGGWIEHDLANISLFWMISEVQAVTELRFHIDYLFTKGTMTRARTVDDKHSYKYGTYPPHDPISQGALVMTLATSFTRQPCFTPGPDDYNEEVHYSVQFQTDVDKWPATLQTAAKHTPKTTLSDLEKELYDKWGEIELVDHQTPSFNSFSTRLRALVHDASHLFLNNENVRA